MRAENADGGKASALALLTLLLTLATPAAGLPLPAAEAQGAALRELTLTVDSGGFNGTTPGPTITLSRGESVVITIINRDTVEHNFVIDEFGVQSPTLQPAESATVAFVADKGGGFTYFCSIPGHDHPGSIIVTGVTGSVSLDKSTYDLSDFARVVVVDPDADATPDDLDTVSVAVRSTTDPSGITLQLLETGVGTGTFEGWFSLTVGPSGAGALQVSEGDLIQAEYVDSSTPTGEAAILTATATVGRAAGEILLTLATDRPEYVRGVDAISVAGTLSKRVGETVTPVANATVEVSVVGELQTLRFRVQTDAEGRFALNFTLPADAPPGLYRVRASAFGAERQVEFTLLTPPAPPTEVATPGPTDPEGQPKAAFSPGESVRLPVAVKNNEAAEKQLLIAVQVFMPDGTVLPTFFIAVTLQPGEGFDFTPTLLLPFDAPTGTWQLEVSIFSDFPAQGGLPQVEPLTQTFAVEA